MKYKSGIFKRSALLYISSIVLRFSFITTSAAALPVDIHFSEGSIPGSQLSDPRELEAFLDSLLQVKMAELHIPGAECIVVKGGEVFFSKGYGYADLEKSIPVNPDRTLFRICSIAKLVTASAVMQLVERELVDLERNVNDYLTHFKIENRFPNPVTMRHLLTHTAGFDDAYLHKVARTAGEQMPLGEFLAKRLPPVITPPGEIATYSNLGNALAGYLVEVVSKQDFAEYVAEHIFKPLEMSRSGFRLPDSLAADLVKGYFYKNDSYIPIPFDYLNDYPAGQMVATATDMAKFMIAHLQKGRYGNGRILAEGTAEQMHRAQFTHHPKMNGASGLAFGIGSLRGLKLLAHDGGYIDASTRLWLFPELSIGIYMACNAMNGRFIDEVSNRLIERYFPAVKGESSAYPFQDIPPYDAEVARFAGTYRFSRYTHGSITKTGILFGAIAPELRIWHNDEGMIMMNDWQGKPRRMIQVEPLLFQSIDDDYYCAFRQDAHGAITHLFTNATAAFEKVPWYYALTFQRVFFFVCFAILLAAFWGIMIQYMIWVLKRRKNTRSASEVRVRRSVFLSSSILLFYPLAFGAMLFFIPESEAMTGFGYGLPGAIYPIQAIPFLGILALLMLLFFLGKSWFSREFSILKKIAFSFVLLAGIGFIWFLQYWNLLGWKL